MLPVFGIYILPLDLYLYESLSDVVYVSIGCGNTLMPDSRFPHSFDNAEGSTFRCPSVHEPKSLVDRLPNPNPIILLAFS